MRLEGKRALVTGSSKGIGAEIAKELAREGANVVINYNSDQEGGKAISKEIQDMGRRSLAVKADVGNSDEARSLVAQANEFLGGLDILVNNAGITPWSKFLETPEEVWDKTLNTNLKSMFVCGQAAGRIMAAQRWGRIVNISSAAGKGAYPDAAHYNASKGGVNMLTLAMANALGEYNITVNAVAPGAVLLERTLNDNPKYNQEWGALTPLGRAGTPQDVAHVVAWLCSDEAAFVSGQIISVDGGLFAAVPWPRNADGTYKPG